MKQVMLLTTMLLILTTGTTQVAINSNGDNPNSSAMLDVSSTNKGMLMPRMTSAQRKAINDPETGLLVFDTDKQTICMFDGVEWRSLSFTTEGSLPPVQRFPASLYPYSQFGTAIAIYNNYAVIGAPADTANKEHGGAAYVFVKQNGTWKLQTRLVPSNIELNDHFGASVDIYNDIIVVGAPKKAISNIVERGRAFVYQRQGENWVPVIGLMASNGVEGDQFGFSVSIYNQMIAVGAPHKDYSTYTDGGCVYIFHFENNFWTQKAIVYGWAPDDNAGFGYDVGLYSNNMVVGAPGTSSSYPYKGSAYTFTNTDANGSIWANGTLLPADLTMPQMRFGFSVAISATTCLVGAPDFGSVNNGNAYAGLAYMYKKEGNNWVQKERIGTDIPNDRVGYSVALDGEDCYVGSPYWDTYRGRLITFKENRRFIYNVDRDVMGYFGRAVAVHNGQYVVGAPGQDGPTVNFGSK
jgi:hypothetical protein